MSLKPLVHKLLTGESLGDTRRWDAETNRVLSTVVGSRHSYSVHSPAVSLHGQIVAEAKKLQAGFPDVSQTEIDVYAEERVRIANLCAARCVLPVLGISNEELEGIGFGLPRRRDIYNVLRLVDFPPDWTIAPVTEALSLENTSHATVFDALSVPKISVFFRIDSGDGYPRARATQL